MIERGDLGIVLYQKAASSADVPTYIDRVGKERSVGELLSTYSAMSTDIDTAHPHSSASAAVSMFVVVQGLSTGETVSVRARQAYIPDPIPSTTPDPHFAGPAYFNTLWVPQEPLANADIEFDLGNGTFLFQTASLLLGDLIEFSAKSASTSASVMIAAKVSPQ